MRNRLIFAVAMTFIVASSANPVWASIPDAAVEEECQLMAIEQNIPDEEIQQFMTDCFMAATMVEEGEDGQEEVALDITLEEDCRSWGLEQQIPDEEIEQFVQDCVAAELEVQKREEEIEQPVQE